ncbi:TPA: hypothetical protein ACH3X3_009833 [Trebouxia sp. C0006]
MQKETAWATLPVEVLRRAFGLQSNSLATCAAASTCAAWHEAAKTSCVNSLYLHGDSDDHERSWESLLAARSSISTLKLVRAAKVTTSFDGFTLDRSSTVSHATMDSLPTACTSLTLSEFCAHNLSRYVEKGPDLEQLSFQWNGLTYLPRSHKHQPVPDLTALRHLTDLTVQMRNDLRGNLFLALIKGCPDTLQSLTLQSFGSEVEDEQPPLHSVQSLHLLESHLTALTHLAITNSVVTIPGDDISCLSKLKSLSLHATEVYVDGQLDVTCLTNLTYLDLSEICCFWDDAWVEALDSFTSWPGLHVLKLVNGNLIDQQTDLDCSSVKELHLNYPNRPLSFVEGQAVHAHMGMLQVLEKFIEPEGPSQHGNAIVGLHITCDCPEDFDTVLQTVALFCPKLQSLHVGTSRATGFRYFGDPVSLFLFSGESATPLRLTSLSLQGITCSQLDLKALTALTHLVVKQVDGEAQLACVILPPGLEVFAFIGNSLFQAGIEHNLDTLKQLSTLKLGPKQCVYTLKPWLPVLPKLPVSLAHLSFEGQASQDIVGWSELCECTGLERLTLGTGHCPVGELQVWIKSAQYVCVVDHDYTVPDTRLPLVDDL